MGSEAEVMFGHAMCLSKCATARLCTGILDNYLLYS